MYFCSGHLKFSCYSAGKDSVRISRLVPPSVAAVVKASLLIADLSDNVSNSHLILKGELNCMQNQLQLLNQMLANRTDHGSFLRIYLLFDNTCIPIECSNEGDSARTSHTTLL